VHLDHCLTPAHSPRLRDKAPLAVVWAVLRPALAPLITAINWIHRCDNAATRSSKTTTSQPYVTGVDTETRSPAAALSRCRARGNWENP